MMEEMSTPKAWVGATGPRMPDDLVPSPGRLAELDTYAVDGDFDEFYSSKRSALVHLAYLLTGSASQAEEATQDAFIRVLERWPRLDNHAAYVRVCVINHCNSWHRRRYTARRYEHLIVAPDGSNDRYNDLGDALARLPRRRRAIVVLRYYDGLTINEIADVLGVTEGTVK
jgi:RNA polymerase sigma factor (sigma-70 family)